MRLTDIHTHILESTGKDSLYCCGTTYVANRNISTGIHPWDVTEHWKEEFSTVEEIAGKKNCLAIGECGIDRLRGCCMEVQEEAFRTHAILAEEIKKPLIIHCVKGADTILAVHKEIKPAQAWIIHGFKGKPEQAIQFTRTGLYLSFGERFNSESLLATPLDKLLIESDESRMPIEEIYCLVAKTKDMTPEELANIVRNNAEKCGIQL